MERGMAFIVKNIWASLLANDNFLFPALLEGLNKIFLFTHSFILTLLYYVMEMDDILHG